MSCWWRPRRRGLGLEELAALAAEMYERARVRPARTRTRTGTSPTAA